MELLHFRNVVLCLTAVSYFSTQGSTVKAACQMSTITSDPTAPRPAVPLNCSSSEMIHVISEMYGDRKSEENCTVTDVSTNHLTGDNNGLAVNCNGKQDCKEETECADCTVTRPLSVVTYECVQGSIDICSEQDIKTPQTPLYLHSPGFLNNDTGSGRCSCRASGSSLDVMVIESRAGPGVINVTADTTHVWNSTYPAINRNIGGSAREVIVKYVREKKKGKRFWIQIKGTISELKCNPISTTSTTTTITTMSPITTTLKNMSSTTTTLTTMSSTTTTLTTMSSTTTTITTMSPITAPLTTTSTAAPTINSDVSTHVNVTTVAPLKEISEIYLIAGSAAGCVVLVIIIIIVVCCRRKQRTGQRNSNNSPPVKYFHEQVDIINDHNYHEIDPDFFENNVQDTRPQNAYVNTNYELASRFLKPPIIIRCEDKSVKPEDNSEDETEMVDNILYGRAKTNTVYAKESETECDQWQMVHNEVYVAGSASSKDTLDMDDVMVDNCLYHRYKPAI